MPWRPLKQFRDPSVPKLDNLRRARAAGLRVPETWWLPAADAALDPERRAPPPSLAGGPVIVRSGSPTEDTFATSNAGQLLSLPVRDPAAFGDALARVVAALPLDAAGRPLGAVFVQPLITGIEAGVVFFDGFYWERTLAPGSNEGLTAGWERGRVERGPLQRGGAESGPEGAWSDWLTAIYAPFRKKMNRIDAEIARDERGWILLQIRPALFPVARNETLSLANHREILGDPPSPWIASALGAAGREVLPFFAAADPAVARWDEVYAVELGERAWMNFSFFFRLMDSWGLPRTFVTEGVGGGDLETRAADRQILPGRLLRKAPRILSFQLRSLRAVLRARRELDRLDRRIANAATLAELHRVNVDALAVAIRTNFAINGILSGVSRLRRLLRLPGAARVATHGMMDEYAALGALPAAEREAGLDRWLIAYGHRGPLESDPARPRFAELREALLRDVLDIPAVPSAAGQAPKIPSRGPGFLRPLYTIDEIREAFRDSLMRVWQRLRERILALAAERVASGDLEAPDDVFWLRGDELAALGAGSLRAAAAAGRERVTRAAALDLPPTAGRDEIERAIASSEQQRAEAVGRHIFPGRPLGPAVVEGRVVKAEGLLDLLAEAGRAPGLLGPDAILVVAALEPSWAVVFPRVGGVVAEIGGELSHASILLREARRPAIVDCAGIFRAVQTGDRLRLDGAARQVEILDSEGGSG
ncbi:MAG TPA: PEP-utilizing enzyme [Thermoanaerobaculia bacterium]|nr:PEP-utilizing enzyme [Thermoanaerobaculia bacterium]